MVRSGASSYVAIGWEATFGGGANNVQLFGKDQKISGLEFTNNQMALPQLYSAEVKDFLYGRNSGGCSVEYVLSNPFQFTSLLYEPISEATSSGIITRTWDSDETVNSNIRKLKTSHLEIGKLLSGENVVRNAKGVVTQTMNLKTSIDSPVQVTQQLVWGREDDISTTLSSGVPNDNGFSPYNFVHTKVELPNSTTLAVVQNLDLTLNINSELLWGIGDANSADAYRKLVDITGKVNLAFQNKTHLQQVRDRSVIDTMRITLSNGKTGADLREIVINLERVGISRHGVPTTSPTEVILQEFDFQAGSIRIVSKDATAEFDWN